MKSATYKVLDDEAWKGLGTTKDTDWAVHFLTWGVAFMVFTDPEHTLKGWHIGPWCRQR